MTNDYQLTKTNIDWKMKDNVGKTVFHFFAQGIEKYFGPVLLASQSFCEIKQGINV